ncbi:thiol-disulfide oxidoreductase DCC family protein [Thalassotalea maritima]|uniref:thiol-disulfide oxidoreductase DCC family protein n=1 Tax=Thalassotalea maritima TaxID=3242416 RepID=UPI003526C4AE
MTQQLTIFYDGHCPLCVKEMRSLAARDDQQQLLLVDIHQPDFEQRYPQISKQQASRILHAIDASDDIILGLDVTYQAWALLGRGHWFVWLRWRWLKPVTDLGYRVFARYRYPLSLMLTGKSRCDSKQCNLSAGDKD